MESIAQSQDHSVTEAHGATLAEWEWATIELFVHAAQLIGIPKSMGQIYGLLFCSPKPLPMDAITEGLGISKGSASQGLRTLRQIGAVQIVYLQGDRRDHFAAELKLRRLFSGFLANQLTPHMQNGTRRLDHIQSLAEGLTTEDATLATERLNILKSWHGKTAKLLPLIQKIL